MDDSKLIIRKIDELSNKIDNVESSLNAKIEGVESSLNARIDGVESSLNAGLGTLDSKVDGVESSLGAKIDSVANDVRRINLKIENEILPKISIIAEGHSILERKLDDALIMKTEHEKMKLIITHHDTEIRDIKDTIGIA